MKKFLIDSDLLALEDRANELLALGLDIRDIQLMQSNASSVVWAVFSNQFNFLRAKGSFLHRWERELLRDLSEIVEKVFSICNIVHIGVEYGASLYCSRDGAPNANIYGIDLIGLDRLAGPRELLNAIEVRGDSREVDFQYPIHFLFVDGDHTYEAAKDDLKKWGGMVVSGGYLAVHDCAGCHWAMSVNKAIDEIINETSWEDLGLVDWTRYFRRR